MRTAAKRDLNLARRGRPSIARPLWADHSKSKRGPVELGPAGYAQQTEAKRAKAQQAWRSRNEHCGVSQVPAGHGVAKPSRAGYARPR
jgi:hypothetical protein